MLFFMGFWKAPAGAFRYHSSNKRALSKWKYCLKKQNPGEDILQMMGFPPIKYRPPSIYCFYASS